MRSLPKVVPLLTLAALSGLMFSGMTLAAQQPNTQPNTSATQQTAEAEQTAAAVPVPSTANAPEAVNAQLRPVNGELVTRIDAKKAKPGEAIVVKTTSKATTADGIVIPKGSKIVGHVTEVQAHTKETPNSKVTVQFDQAELKDGKTLPIKSVIESVAPAGGMADNDVNPFGTGAPMASGGSPSAGSPNGPGMTPGQASQPTQAQANTEATMGTQAHNGPQPGTVVATQGNVAVKTTAIPGVLIATNSNGQPFTNASGALLGAKQNVDLDNGTHIVLAIADVPNQSQR